MRLAVDASVAAKWFFTEPLADEARRLLADAYELFAPDLWHAEVGNATWVKVRHGDADPVQAAAVTAALLRMPVTIKPTASLLPAAVDLSIRLGHPIYDCCYLALCQSEGCQFVTADDRLRKAAVAGGLGGVILWIEDVPPV